MRVEADKTAEINARHADFFEGEVCLLDYEDKEINCCLHKPLKENKA